MTKTETIEGFGNACSEAESTAKSLKKKTKAEPVFVVVTGDPDPSKGISCPPAALKAYQYASVITGLLKFLYLSPDNFT